MSNEWHKRSFVLFLSFRNNVYSAPTNGIGVVLFYFCHFATMCTMNRMYTKDALKIELLIHVCTHMKYNPLRPHGLAFTVVVCISLNMNLKMSSSAFFISF
jgi:hypothetical protein